MVMHVWCCGTGIHAISNFSRSTPSAAGRHHRHHHEASRSSINQHHTLCCDLSRFGEGSEGESPMVGWRFARAIPTGLYLRRDLVDLVDHEIIHIIAACLHALDIDWVITKQVFNF